MTWLYAKGLGAYYNIGTAIMVAPERPRLIGGGEGQEVVVVSWSDQFSLSLREPEDKAEALRWCEQHSEGW